MKRADYLLMLEEGYESITKWDTMGRLEYLSDHIFDFTTYDGGMAKLFAEKALEVCEAINTHKTHEYIDKDQEKYEWYLLMVNMPFFCNKLDWGTSIRGAWWSDSMHGKIAFDGSGLCLHGKQQGTLEFTREEWHEFIDAVLSFAKENKE